MNASSLAGLSGALTALWNSLRPPSTRTCALPWRRSRGTSGRSTTRPGPPSAVPAPSCGPTLGEQGFIGVNVPVEYGGGGGGLTELAIVCEELAAQGTPLLLLLVSAAISAEVIAEFGTEEQRKTWLPGLAAGTSKVVFAITEPDAGSNTHRLTTAAVRDGDDWLLSGTKYYISGVDEASALLVVAQDRRRARTGPPGCPCSSFPPTRPACSGSLCRST